MAKQKKKEYRPRMGLLLILSLLSRVVFAIQTNLESSSGTRSPQTFKRIADWQGLPEATKDKILADCSQHADKKEDSWLSALDGQIDIQSDQNFSNNETKELKFLQFRLQYLIAFVAVMLADGMQGTHLYVLYEGYNFNVATLYASGFVMGAISSPLVGPIVDNFGRRKAAMMYCFLEMIINTLEQYECLPGVIAARLIGGITTNLLFTVFEAWLITEHRQRNFPEEKLEIVLRDTVISSNLSAIASGFIAHKLAETFGAQGPFKGAVACTSLALLLVGTKWEENYGGSIHKGDILRTMSEAVNMILADSTIFRLGLIQGLTEGALQTFVFLWSPYLLQISSKMYDSSCKVTLNKFTRFGLDKQGLPAFGLIFGSFMLFGALGGLAEPVARKIITKWTRPLLHLFIRKRNGPNSSNNDQHFLPDEIFVKILCTMCFAVCTLLLSLPALIQKTDYCAQLALPLSLISFLLYEFLVGMYMPCEGLQRSWHMPNQSICSLMTILRVIVNLAVALGVASTNYFSISTVFSCCSVAVGLASIIQFSLVLDGLKDETRISKTSERSAID